MQRSIDDDRNFLRGDPACLVTVTEEDERAWRALPDFLIADAKKICEQRGLTLREFFIASIQNGIDRRKRKPRAPEKTKSRKAAR